MRPVLIIFFLPIFLFGCQTETAIKTKYDNFELVELGNGVYSCIHKFGGKATCNVGIVDNGSETFIFDSFLSPDVALELLNALESLDLSPVKYVVNSHFPNDHIRGNQVFSNEVKIISTSRTRELIEEEEPLQIAYEKENAPAQLAYYDSLYNSFNGDRKSREFQQILLWRPYYETLANSYLEVETRLPDMIVDSLYDLDGPDRRIQLISRGPGHSESDLIMYLPDDEILFSGDLIFNNCHPYVPHGDILKWSAWLDFMSSLDVSKVMPGHGPMGTRELIDRMKSYLRDLQISADIIAKSNTPIEDHDFSIPERYEDWWFDRFYEYNLRFAYESLVSQEIE